MICAGAHEEPSSYCRRVRLVNTSLCANKCAFSLQWCYACISIPLHAQGMNVCHCLATFLFLGVDMHQHSYRHSYEASAIASWLESHDTSPMTNEEMNSKIVAPNKSLKAVIDILFPVC